MDSDTSAFLQAEAEKAARELGVKPDDAQPTAEPAPEPQPAEPQPMATQGQDEPPVAPEATPEPQAPVVQSEEDDDYPSFNPYQYQQPVQQPQVPVQQYPQVPQQPQPPAPQQVPQAPQAVPQVPQLDVSQFTDQYGNVDVSKFSMALRQRDEALVSQVTSSLNDRFTGNFSQMAAAIVQQARTEASNQIMAAEGEKRAWERTFAKYPQVKENKDLRDQIHKMRLGEIAVTGKPVSPQKMADRYFEQIRAAREDGVRQAVETTRVQATAHLETAANTAADKGLQTRQNWDRVGSRDRREAQGARTDILKQMLADGKL